MKTVLIRPERCVGCMQCSIACAVAHSKSGDIASAVFEKGVSPRMHVGPGPANFAYPNKCRHCDPAPCLTACMPRAITRDTVTSATLVNPSRCINCGMCSMACPFGVIRYRNDHRVPAKGAVAVKCDNCSDRQKAGKVPACVEACKAGALLFGDSNDFLKGQTREMALRVGKGAASSDAGETSPTASLWRAFGGAEAKVS